MAKDPRADRHDRLRNALRENLKRRKAQAKGRAAATDSPGDDGSDERAKSAQPIGQTGTKGPS